MSRKKGVRAAYFWAAKDGCPRPVYGEGEEETWRKVRAVIEQKRREAKKKKIIQRAFP